MNVYSLYANNCLNIWIDKEFNGMSDILVENEKTAVICYDYVYFLPLEK